MREPRAKVLQQAKDRHKKAIENYRLAKANKKGVSKARTEERLALINKLKVVNGDQCKFTRIANSMTLIEATRLLHEKTGKEIHSELIKRMENGERVPNHVSYKELLSIYPEQYEINLPNIRMVEAKINQVLKNPSNYFNGKVGGWCHKATKELQFLAELRRELIFKV